MLYSKQLSNNKSHPQLFMNKIALIILSNLFHVKKMLGNNANYHIAIFFRKRKMEIGTPIKDQKNQISYLPIPSYL